MLNITAEQSTDINRVGHEYNLKLVILYGSRAKDHANSESDVDIAVLGYKGVPHDSYLKFFDEFAHIFKTNNIDVKTLHGKDILFRFQVMRDGVLLFGDHTDFIEYQMYAYAAYRDAQDLFKLQEQIIEKRQENLMRHIQPATV